MSALRTFRRRLKTADRQLCERCYRRPAAKLDEHGKWWCGKHCQRALVVQPKRPIFLPKTPE